MAKHSYSDIKNIIAEEITEVTDLVLLLELTIEDVLEAFPDQVVDNAYKFMLPDITDGVLDDDEEEDEGTEEI